MILCAMQSFEQLNQRAVAVVVDPIQSVKGKVVIDAFRYGAPVSMHILWRVYCSRAHSWSQIRWHG